MEYIQLVVTHPKGFSVEGDENNQETRSKQLILGQFLMAMMTLKKGGDFACKLFDVFTPFTVGLLYILFRHFEEFAIVKPFTSRPANSERYVLCRGFLQRQPDVTEYLFSVNEKLNSLQTTQEDVLHLVDESRIDTNFLKYIRNSNIELCKIQIEALKELFKYVEDRQLLPLDQQDIKRRCFTEWDIPLELPKRRLQRDNYGFGPPSQISNNNWDEEPSSKRIRVGFYEENPSFKTKEEQAEEARHRRHRTVFGSSVPRNSFHTSSSSRPRPKDVRESSSPRKTGSFYSPTEKPTSYSPIETLPSNSSPLYGSLPSSTTDSSPAEVTTKRTPRRNPGKRSTSGEPKFQLTDAAKAAIEKHKAKPPK